MDAIIVLLHVNLERKVIACRGILWPRPCIRYRR